MNYIPYRPQSYNKLATIVLCSCSPKTTIPGFLKSWMVSAVWENTSTDGVWLIHGEEAIFNLLNLNNYRYLLKAIIIQQLYRSGLEHIKITTLGPNTAQYSL